MMWLHDLLGRRSLKRLNGPVRVLARAFAHCSRTVKEYDVLFLRQHGVKHAKWHLTGPLRPGARVKLSYGASIPASDLIGRQVLDRVRDSAGNSVILHEPTLASYIVNNERLATPIYPHDANTIVSLLDLNPSRPGEDEDESEPSQPFEIFEAGTGMGSLTLHLARALHAANPPLPPPLRHLLHSTPFAPNYDFSSSRACLAVTPAQQALLDAYASSRRAVLHTLDRNPKHARAAYRLVRDFRRAQYLPSVDFHVGSVEAYLAQRLEQSGGRPFLAHAVLDMPAAHDNAARVVEALVPNGLLVVFNPSISQIAEFQAWMTATDQPLRLEKVVELDTTTVSEAGMHDSAGGRHWDVKTVMPKAQDGDEEVAKPVQVMRPKVGERVAGGGFVAVTRRWPISTGPVEEETTRETEAGETSSQEKSSECH